MNVAQPSTVNNCLEHFIHIPPPLPKIVTAGKNELKNIERCDTDKQTGIKHTNYLKRA